MSKAAFDRLRKEFVRLQKAPPEYIEATPLDSDILTWHYVITGPADSPYAGGVYHGKLIFPPQYPFKPPAIQMCTPSGRFKVDTRLCLSMSDFHPETWNPMWSVSSILSGLLSFMLESTPTQGSVETSDAVKREYATRSREYNMRNPIFKKLFPKYGEGAQDEQEQDSEVEEAEAGVAALAVSKSASASAATTDDSQTAESASAASAAAPPAATAAAAAAPAAPAAAPAPAPAPVGAAPPNKVLRLGALAIRADDLFDYVLALIALCAIGLAAALCAIR